MRYRIEHRIQTLAQNAVMADGKPPTFSVEGIEFSHWDFNYRDGWRGDAWLASGVVDAPNYRDAYYLFSGNLARIVPRIALISQCFISYLQEAFVVRREDSDVAFFRWSSGRQPVGLMFTEKEKAALAELLCATTVPDAFFHYWHDAVNATTYSAKLLLMLSALEALVKTPKGKKDWDLLDQILGTQLVTALWGTKGNSRRGLRHRLVHGEYFSTADADRDYVQQVHSSIVHWVNRSVLSDGHIAEGVVQPHRHFFGNREGVALFVRAVIDRDHLTLKPLLDAHNGYRFTTSTDRYRHEDDPAFSRAY